MSKTQSVNPVQVSVVMATNSVGNYFEAAVESVLSSKDIDWELIVVLDGIPNPEVQWMLEHPSIKFIYNQTSRGLPAALNLGISYAEYDYIARLDSDDLMTSGRLLKQSEFLSRNPEVAIVGTSISIIDSNGNYIGEHCHSKEIDARQQLLRRNVLVHSSVMFRKSDWKNFGGYDEELKQMEDYHFWLRLATIGEVHNIDEQLTIYRIHQNQMSKKAGFSSNYIYAISRARKKLGKSLKVSRFTVFKYDQVWKVAQLMRALGFRKKFAFSLNN